VTFVADDAFARVVDERMNAVFAGDFLYWANATSRTIYVVSVLGGTPRPVISNETTGWQVVTDGASLYWVAPAANAVLVRKVSVSGGTAATVATGSTTRSIEDSATPQVAVDGANLYWLAPPNVYRAPK